MTILAIAPIHNTKGKRDATHAFIPEANRFVQHWGHLGARLRFIDNRRSREAMRRQVVFYLDEFQPLTQVAFFCHGWRTGMQFGFNVGHTAALARHLYATRSDLNTIVTLYCCSTAQGDAGGDGGFADSLRDAMCEAGLIHCLVDAHTTKGHTTRNPHVRRFAGQGSPTGGQGGQYIVRPKSALWPAWKAAIQAPTSPLRYRMSHLPIPHIHQILSSRFA